MSITITFEFQDPRSAENARDKLRRQGYLVSSRERPQAPAYDSLLVAYPFGAPGGNSSGNNLMGALPPLAGNGVLLHQPEVPKGHLLSVLTDDVGAPEARRILTAFGGKAI